MPQQVDCVVTDSHAGKNFVSFAVPIGEAEDPLHRTFELSPGTYRVLVMDTDGNSMPMSPPKDEIRMPKKHDLVTVHVEIAERIKTIAWFYTPDQKSERMQPKAWNIIHAEVISVREEMDRNVTYIKLLSPVGTKPFFLPEGTGRIARLGVFSNEGIPWDYPDHEELQPPRIGDRLLLNVRIRTGGIEILEWVYRANQLMILRIINRMKHEAQMP